MIQHRIKELRLTRGMSLADLSARAGLPEEQLLRIEQGERLPSLEVVQSLASALGVQLGDLL
jgi:transcriptional regulator with XRE-family HTH domain